jgi:predicted ATPase
MELASTEEVLQALLGDDPSLTPLTPRLLARTQGNPFFLEESVRTLVETGVLVGEPGVYRLGQALPAIQVAATVQAVLAARIDRLPPEAKRLLQTAAVIGHEVPLPLLNVLVCKVAWSLFCLYEPISPARLCQHIPRSPRLLFNSFPDDVLIQLV